MAKAKTFVASGATIKLDNVMVIEPITEPALAADAEVPEAVRVHLNNGTTVRVDGDEEVHDFIEALDEHLEAT